MPLDITDAYCDLISYLYSPPKYITPDIDQKTSAFSVPPKDKFINNAIVTQTKLRIWQSDLCGQLAYPTTIIEFKDGITNCRTDSQLSRVSHKPVCQAIRSCLYTTRCKKCDKRLADIFNGATVGNIEEIVKKRLKDYSQKYNNNAYANSENMPSFVSDDYHGHLAMPCPMSGYTELVFPIVVDKTTVIGVLFVGQISLKSKIPEEKRLRRKFLNSTDIKKELIEYIDKAKTKGLDKKLRNIDDLINYIVDNSETDHSSPFPFVWTEDNDELLSMFSKNKKEVFDDTTNEYDEFITKIITSLKTLENLLQIELDNTRKRYINNCINNASERFFDSFATFRCDGLSDEPIRTFWGLPKKQLNGIIDQLAIPYIAVLGSERIQPARIPGEEDNFTSATNNQVLTTQLTVRPSTIEKPAFINDIVLSIDLKELNSKTLPQKPEILKPNHPICENFGIFTSSNKKRIIYFPMLGINSLPIIVFVVFGINKEDSIIDEISKFIQDFMMNVFYALSMVMSYISENRASNAMIMYRHETAQLAAAINKVNMKYIKPENSIIERTRKNSLNLYETLEECVEILSKLSDDNTNLPVRVLNDQFNLYTHEVSQVIVALNHICKRLLSEHSTYLEKKKQDIYETISSFTLQLRSMSDRIKIIQGRHTIDKNKFEEIFVIKELFNKWASAFSLDELARYLRFIMPVTNRNDDMRPSIITDFVLLNQIVYNLFGNAIKYSYRGTAIQLNYGRPFRHSSQKAIEVVNYGIEITNDQEEPYKLYNIGDNARKFSDESSGIGLYVAKRSTELLGGNISHVCKSVSKFVVPYMQPFLDICKSGQIECDQDLIRDVHMELARLKEIGLYDVIISHKNILSSKEKGEIPITESEILEEIQKRIQTYEVRFEVALYD